MLHDLALADLPSDLMPLWKFNSPSFSSLLLAGINADGGTYVSFYGIGLHWITILTWARLERIVFHFPGQ